MTIRSINEFLIMLLLAVALTITRSLTRNTLLLTIQFAASIIVLILMGNHFINKEHNEKYKDKYG